ncbi:hypothetical protein DIURU_002882 [Diutina rugosa]|uniref:DNA-directed RNA polymerase III subunit RPC5 n=1 Tax=Diutina rugosa TaxID=5481 RepID=A0A642UQH7_DIURU|nr:uncharacterized protein DIURU_002882 [Diutina rugosa]KAA8902428.1 hypothetical protein DIURU_002882 [Diutina rugosa]
MAGKGLFVDEEEHDAVVVKEEPVDVVVMDVDTPEATETGSIDAEEADSDTRADDDSDDPVINTVPVLLNQVSEGSYHILQFPGRPKSRDLPEDIKPAVKPKSNYLQIKQPLDTSKFFNVNKQDSWGEEIGEQTVEGVLDPAKGMYVCRVVDGKVVMTPIASSVQLRPKFEYIDAVDKASAAAQRKEHESAAKPQTMQILSSVAKAPTQNLNADGYNGALGEALRYIKQFDEEEWVGLSWKSEGIDEALPKPEEEVITTTATKSDYIDMITSDLANL